MPFSREKKKLKINNERYLKGPQKTNFWGLSEKDSSPKGVMDSNQCLIITILIFILIKLQDIISFLGISCERKPYFIQSNLNIS